MGRPPTKPKQLRDGFYIEVRNKRAASGVNVRRASKKPMMQAIKEYERAKEIIVLGEFKNSKWVDKPKK